MWRKSLEDWLSMTSLSGFNQLYIEQLYEQYNLDPNSVDANWASLFRDLESGSLINKSRYYESYGNHDQAAVQSLINTYRYYGHLIADIDPLKQWKRNPSIAFNLVDFNLHPDQEVKMLEPIFGQKVCNVGDLFIKLQQVYTGHIGYEFNHITDIAVRDWLTKQIESPQRTISDADKVKILNRVVKAEQLETSLANKFPGAKRFSLEGNESFVVLLDQLINMAGDNNFRDVFISMAHRGRLNTLVNHCDLNSQELFSYFTGSSPVDLTRFAGDVKYHLGRDLRMVKTTPYANLNNKIINNPYHQNLDIHLCYNPSHLEFVGPVCMGAARATQSSYNKELQAKEYTNRGCFAFSKGTDLVLPIIVHGDSAVSGQGIVQETLNMSRARAYSVGGTIHVVINNQIGFTTNNRKDMRSSIYATDIAKMVEAPIIHVNGDDPVAVAQVAILAFKYRQRFKRDIFIDLVGYRRLGHNESDDPSVTQPIMYKLIKAKPLISTIFGQDLVRADIINLDYLPAIRKKIYQEFQSGDYRLEIGNLVTERVLEHQASFKENEFAVTGRPYDSHMYTEKALDKRTLRKLAIELATVPPEVELTGTCQKVYAKRLDNAIHDGPLSWGEAELLAYTSLLHLGHNVRLTGEDSGRGTFAHRMAVGHNVLKEQEWIPMLDIAAEYGRKFEIWDSTLSENGVLGFEYGYSITDPKTLTVWEAQFGDFSNCAQVIIDQFIASGETKWDQLSGLTMLLPHGYEGQGAEHSSTRIERYLQLCSQNNMRVVVPTTAAQIYHLMLQQGLSSSPKPLIIATPKSLLRAPQTVTSFDELVHGDFEPLLYSKDKFAQLKANIKKLVITNGRLRFDVLDQMVANENFGGEVFQVNLEQLYPFPMEALQALIADLPALELIEWTQDEPENQGSWNYALPLLIKLLGDRIGIVHLGVNSRPASATTATGYASTHKAQLAAILAQLGNRTTYLL